MRDARIWPVGVCAAYRATVKDIAVLSVDGYAAPTNFTPGNPITNPSIFVLGSLSRISSGRLRLRPRLEKPSVHFQEVGYACCPLVSLLSWLRRLANTRTPSR
jgi:hypothetical protein